MTETADPQTARTVPMWAINALSKRVGTVDRIERAKVLEERTLRKSAIVYSQGGAFYVTKGLGAPRVVKLDEDMLDRLGEDAVAVDCPSCEAQMRLHNFEAPGSVTCAACGTGLEVAEDLTVSRAKAPAARSAPAAKRAPGAKPKARRKAPRAIPGLVGDFTPITGIGPKYTQSLHRQGIKTYRDLLAAKPAEIADVVGISPEQALEYQKEADLTRVDGIGGRTADILRSAGIRTLRELAESDAKAAAEKVNLVKRDLGIGGNGISKAQMGEWISEAKRLVR